MRIKNIIFVLLLLLPIYLYGQNEDPANLLQIRRNRMPPDVLYILPSKNVYETGEDMWFKVWLFDSSSFALSNMSQTLDVRIYSSTDSLVWDEKYPINSGRTDGHVYIGDNWKNGEYRIEGYAKSSFYNDSTEAIYPRKILIVSRIVQLDSLQQVSYKCDSLQRLSANRINIIKLKFYPEGGNMVNDILGDVAFKATDILGFPMNVSGTVYDDNTEICRLNSEHDGMGVFPLSPVAGHIYNVRLSDGSKFFLPAALSNSMSLHLEYQDTSKVVFTIKQKQGQPSCKVFLFAQMRGIPCCGAKCLLNDSLQVSLPSKDFPYQGIAEVTLYNSTMHPVAERLVYVHSEKKLHITAETNNRRYNIRERGNLKLHVTDKSGNPVQAELCVSIFDKSYLSPTSSESLLSHCYLSEQIHGNIYNPTYYFNEENVDRYHSLDLLLQTQGWRSYTWDTNRSNYNGESFLTDEITGVEFVGKKKKANNGHIGQQVVQVSGPKGTSKYIWTDTLGNFTVPTDIMENLRGGYIYIKPMLGDEFKPKLSIYDPFSNIAFIRKSKPKYELVNKWMIEKPIDISIPVSSISGAYLLKGVTITSKKKYIFRDKMIGRLDSLARVKLGIGWVCDCTETHPFLNDYEYGYTHHPEGYSGRRMMPERGKTYQLIKYVQNAKGVWYVKDMKEITYQGPQFTEEELLKMNHIWQVKGYYGERDFYQPEDADLMSSIPDARNTILWAPSVLTDKNGNAEVSFATSDVNEQFIGIIEGTDDAGLLGCCKFKLNVVKGFK
jgi:hypothetical protein